VIAQVNRDQAIRNLLETMKDVYDVMLAADKLDSEVHYGTVKLIFQQTTECTWFIRDYASRNYSEIISSANLRPLCCIDHRALSAAHYKRCDDVIR
jgi:hypothetical protein